MLIVQLSIDEQLTRQFQFSQLLMKRFNFLIYIEISIKTKAAKWPSVAIHFHAFVAVHEYCNSSVVYVREHKTELECLPMPNVMAAMPNIGGISVQRRKVWLTPTTRVLFSNAAKTWNPLKFAGVPQTHQQISAASGPKFTILWVDLGETFLFSIFFPIVDACLRCEDIAQQSCAMVPRWQIFGDFLCAVFSASRVQHVSDLNLHYCTMATPCV